MSDDEEDHTCPLCEEEMDLSDKNFIPCPCGYRVCMWCWHHIKENLNGLCPACRTPYNSDPHAFSAVDRQEIVKKNRERKLKEKQEKKVSERPIGGVTKSIATVVDRKHLHNYRVVQRNLLYVIGLPSTATSEEILRKAEYFGQYGKISKVVVHKNLGASHPTISAYVTFSFKEDAKAAIQALDAFWIDGHPLRASFGTTKYCNNFIRNVPCTNPECVYLHELGDDDDRFTKEEIQAGHTKLNQTPGKDQSIVTGCGGPSGTGKRPVGETILPPPVFIQDNQPHVNKVGKAIPNNNLEVTESQASLQPSSPALNTMTKETKETSGFGSNDEFQALNEDFDITHSLITPPLAANGDIVVGIDCSMEEIAEAAMSESNLKDNTEYSLSEADFIDTRTFNGMTMNAVFPVPSSSLVITVWSGILKAGNPNLKSNPFGRANCLFSELLDLTLPPVDSIAISSMYRMPNISQYSSKDISSFTVEAMSNESTKGASNIAYQPSQVYAKLEQPNKLTAASNNHNSSITALKQLFPGVNLNYGGVPGNVMTTGVGNRL